MKWKIDKATTISDEREETIRKELRRRLRHVCSDLSEDDFSQLLEKMTATQLRDARRGSFPDRP